MMQFVKMHALGNDFMFIDARHQSITLTTAQIQAWANRHEGVGFDQLLLLESAKNQEIDGVYRIFNADGHEVSQCGNGARCVAHYLYLKGKARHEPVILSSQAGIITVTNDFNQLNVGTSTQDMDYYRAALAVPTFIPEKIPLNMTMIDKQEATLDKAMLTWTYQGTRYQGGIVNVGNPHWVIPVETWVEDTLCRLGAVLQVEPSYTKHVPLFPEGVNVTWVEIQNRHEVRIKTYERGVGLTRACGSAAAATAVVAISQGWCDNPVRVNVADGHLMVTWEGMHTPVFVTGPAVLVFHGDINGFTSA